MFGYLKYHQSSIYFRLSALLSLVIVIMLILVGSRSTAESNNGKLLDQPQGYWGEVTSTIDWCEENYAYSHYIAEFWNTVSSLGISSLGFLGILLHPKAESRFVVLFLALGTVGLGSAAFHAVLKFECQLADELPMLFCNTAFIYCLLEMGHQQVKRRYLAPMLLLFVSLFTALYVVVPMPTVFQLTWALSSIWLVYLTIMFNFTLHPSERAPLRGAVNSIAVSAFLWLLEQACCDLFSWIRPLRLHAIWHLGTSFCAYSAIVGFYYGRSKYTWKQSNISLSYFLGFFPYVSFLKY